MSTSLTLIILLTSRTNDGDLLRIWVRRSPKLTFPLDFYESAATHRTLKKSKRFTDHLTLSPYNMIPGSSVGVVKKKRKLFPGQRLTSPSSLTLPYEPGSTFRNFSRIPFHPWGQPWDETEPWDDGGPPPHDSTPIVTVQRVCDRV